ncbi:hypothetical protein HAZT_HAZT000216 [Hyalella azteca]|uniref:Ig-like domain-containing protein n=1 Tax=Hyalella azteca TaxID=294128 RepID=A0A6A0H105_HYAAZ|nr:hypothetical protein HAZT_HAZT000216 [Hyalella azteca]
MSVFPPGPWLSIVCSARGQFYQAGRSVRSQPTSMPHDPTFSSGRIQEGSKASKAPFTVVRGQYSKSELVNTQSLAHSYIYDPDMPIFDLDHSANVTGLLGKTAVLNCRVRNIGNKTVSD